jgi:ABC-type transport system involved in multi-copper enzyme maturation permease subunit
VDEAASAPPPSLPDPAQAALVLLAYTVLFVSVTVWRFRSRDVTSS